MTTSQPRRTRALGRLLGGAVRRVVVTVIGVAVLVAGFVMLVTPGPGLVGVAAGLAILATQYDWADRAREAVRRRSRTAYDHARAKVDERRKRTG